jgi:hypothetical protein
MKRKFDIPRQYTLDCEVVDRMAVHSLKDHYNTTLDELDNFLLHQQGHPDDYDLNLELKKALKIVLDYYGS